MITSYERGHKIYFDNGTWKYLDNKSESNYKRNCIKCNLPPTIEGYDPCLGYLENVKSACCGHGVVKGYILFEDGTKKDT